MPFVDDNPNTIRGPEGVPVPDATSPSIVSTFASAFRHDNPTVNVLRSAFQQQFPPVDGYNPFEDIRDTKYFDNHSDNFLASRSPEQTRSIMRKIDEEDQDNELLARSGTAGFIARIVAGTADPTIAMPGGAIVRGVKGGYSVGRTALATALAGGAQVATQEAILQANQETRTAGESAVSIGTGTLLGSLIGAGAAKLLSRGERLALERSLEADRAAMDAHAGNPPPAASNLPPVPEWLQQARNDAVDFANRLGVTDDIRRMAGEGKTADQISKQLGERLSVDQVRAVRDSLGIAPAGPQGSIAMGQLPGQTVNPGAPRTVIWSNKDFDIPVSVLDDPPQRGPDGRVYQKVMHDGKESYVPQDELRGDFSGAARSGGAAATNEPPAGGPETILGAAVTAKDGKVFVGPTHTNAEAQAADHYKVFSAAENDLLSTFDGFLTSHGRLVSREEALKIADAGEQGLSRRRPDQTRLRGEQLGDRFGPEADQQLEAAIAIAEGRSRGPEKVQTAAIRVGDQIYTGVSHGDAVVAAEDALGLKPNTLFAEGRPPVDNGFVTTTGRFVDRHEADRIARGAAADTGGLDSWDLPPLEQQAGLAPRAPHPDRPLGDALRAADGLRAANRVLPDADRAILGELISAVRSAAAKRQLSIEEGVVHQGDRFKRAPLAETAPADAPNIVEHAWLEADQELARARSAMERIEEVKARHPELSENIRQLERAVDDALAQRAAMQPRVVDAGPERVVGATIIVDGRVFIGGSHLEALENARKAGYDFEKYRENFNEPGHPYLTKGDFISSTGRLLSSEEAAALVNARNASTPNAYMHTKVRSEHAGIAPEDAKEFASKWNGKSVSELTEPEPPSAGFGGGTPTSGGAAATDTRQLEMFPSIPLPKFMQPVADMLSPALRRGLNSAAVRTRRAFADLASSPYTFKENVPVKETFVGPDGKTYTNERPAIPTADRPVDIMAEISVGKTKRDISLELHKQFADYRFADENASLPGLRARAQDFLGNNPEGKMNYTDFKREVWEAFMKEDRHAIPQVSNAAVYIRSLIEPWAERADHAIDGFKRLEPVKGESYAPHYWNQKQIRENPSEFVDDQVKILAADQDVKRDIQARLTALTGELAAARKDIAKAKTDPEIVAAQARHDGIRAKIEREVGAWDGKSAAEGKTALKQREKYDAARKAKAAVDGKAEPKDRLTMADESVDGAVQRMLAAHKDLSPEELRDIANELKTRILNSNPDGRMPYDLSSGGPRVGVSDGSAPRGSLAGRQYNITNAQASKWIEGDIEEVTNRWLRTVVPDVLLAEKFGDPEMSMVFRQHHEDYANLIDAATSKKEKVRLGKEQETTAQGLAGLRDRVRGTFGWSADQSTQNMARVAQSVKMANNLTSLGSVALTSLPDAAGMSIFYGLKSAIGDGFAPFMKALTTPEGRVALGKFKHDAAAANIGFETMSNARQRGMDDITDMYRPQNRFERVLHAANDKYFNLNLLGPWTDAVKLMAAHVSVSNILRASKAVVDGKATKDQLTKLAASYISEHQAATIWRQFSAPGNGSIEKGVMLPNTKNWADQSAAEALQAAVNRETNIMVVTPGQEKALWLSKPILSLFGQYMSFGAAATEKILIRNLQLRDAHALGGIAASVGLGMLGYKLNSVASGKPTSDRPQDWVKEGVNRSSILGLFENANTIMSKATGGKGDIYSLIGADKPVSRNANQGAADMLLGPTWPKVKTIMQTPGTLVRGDWSAADTSAWRRMIATQNLFYTRRLWDQVEDKTNSAFGIPERKPPRTLH